MRRDGVSNHQPHHCLLNRLFRRRSKKASKLCVTGLWVTGEVPAQMASNAEMLPFDDVIMYQYIFRRSEVSVTISYTNALALNLPYVYLAHKIDLPWYNDCISQGTTKVIFCHKKAHCIFYQFSEVLTEHDTAAVAAILSCGQIGVFRTLIGRKEMFMIEIRCSTDVGIEIHLKPGTAMNECLIGITKCEADRQRRLWQVNYCPQISKFCVKCIYFHWDQLPKWEWNFYFWCFRHILNRM